LNIPKKIVLFGHTYDVKMVDEKGGGTEAFGSHWGKLGKIFLNDSLGKEQLESTFLHELIEAVNWHLDLKLEHRFIVALEAGLYSALKQMDKK
jgi:hypothetical protein